MDSGVGYLFRIHQQSTTSGVEHEVNEPVPPNKILILLPVYRNMVIA